MSLTPPQTATQPDPFSPLVTPVAEGAGEFDRLQQRAMTSPLSSQMVSPSGTSSALPPPMGLMPVVARLQGFDLDDRPMLADLPSSPGEWVTARTTVPLTRAMCGQQAVVMFENGDLRRPIIMGILQMQAVQPLQTDATSAAKTTVQVDGESRLIEAEREVVLRCGEASITLTRAGKVIIQGNYILSRSRGYNKIKGAAIDIN